MRLHGAIGSHHSHLSPAVSTPLSIDVSALIGPFHAPPQPEPPRVSQVRAHECTRLVEARALMCLEFANPFSSFQLAVRPVEPK